MTPIESKKISPLAKWLAVGISTFMCAYGIFIITTQHYYGHTSKFGGAEVSADGLDAIIYGVAIMVIGLTPMSLWAKSGQVAGLWAGGCMAISILLFLAPVYIR
jgi:hypothetical protein